MTLSNILTLIFSSGALCFSFLNYNRGRRLDNENFIYKTKVEVYVKILGDLEKLLRFLSDNIEEAKEYLEKPNKENFKILNEMADEVDDTCYEFNNFITGNSLIIPEKIVKLLSHFCDKVLDSETIDSDTKSIDDAEKRINELIKEAEDIGVELRKDLHVDELNSSLFRRIK